MKMKLNKRVVSMALVAAMAVTSLPTVAMAQNADTKNPNRISYDNYELKWEDDFNGNSLNRDNWNVELHDPGWVNEELQAYVDSEENISVKDGNLYLTPIKKDNGDGTYSYTSGRVNTQHKQDFTYGLFECRAKVPAGMGYLPAFWLMASDENVYGQWPRCGEIDCMEVMGQNTKKAMGTIHYGNPHQESQGTYTLQGDDSFSDEFHTFQCEWEPGKIKWYVDGNLYHEEDDWYSTTEGQGTLSYPAPFDQPFYVILNLAVGGSWVGYPDENTSFDNNPYVIDYVKVYQKDSYDENVTRPVKEINLREPNADGNYINNGDFAVAEDLTDDADWKFLTALGGEATASIADNTMAIATTNDGTVDYSVQLVQANLPFEKGATYEVKFDAYASEARTMRTDIKAPDHGYCTYMPTMKVDLTTEKQTFTQTFKMKDASDANGRLEYNMGKAGSTADIYISNVSVKKIADADPNEKEEKTVLSNGNYVYNGGFQEGDYHLGYWDVTNTDASKVSVTGFADGRRFKVENTAELASDAVKLTQTDLTFTPGKPYALSFTAEGEAGKDITVTLGGQKFTATLDGNNKKYSFRVPADAEFANQTLEFELGAPSYVLIDNVRLSEDALITNGSFNDGFIGYEWYCDTTADASYVVDSLSEDNALDVTINNVSTDDWRIQVKQNNVTLEKGKWYTLTFSAKSSADRDIRVIMQGGESKGYPVYSGENTVSLSSEYKTFKKTFQMTEATDPAAFLSICLGKVGEVPAGQHRVCIDNISLVETSDPAANILKNADFADGMNQWTETIANWGPDYSTVASSSIKDGAITYSIENAGTDNWHVQLKQTGLEVSEGETYKVSFDATSTVTRNILAGVQDGISYNQYNQVNEELNAKEPKHITFDFTMDGSENPIEFYVSMGLVGASTPASDITLSNFVIVKADSSEKTDGDKDDTEEPTEAVEPEGNHLVNADFADGMNHWNETIANWGGDAIAEASHVISDGAISYDIKNPGNEEWHVQLVQPGVVLKKDQKYTVSFDATSTATRAIVTGLQENGGAYEQYGKEVITLNANEPTHVEYEFTMNKTDDASAFYVSMGKMLEGETPASVITLSNFSIVKSEPKTEEETCAHDYVDVVVPATYTTDGYTAKVCSKCDDVIDRETIYRFETPRLNISKVTYTGKAITPKVEVTDIMDNVIDSKFYTVTVKNNKNVGIATVTVKFNGNYDGECAVTFKIIPTKVTVKKLTSIKKGFKLTWKKHQTQTDAFQLQYSTSKSFKKATTKTITSKKATSKTIKGLKAHKKYYVRIRAYKKVTVNGKATKIYSSWSTAKKVTTK